MKNYNFKRITLTLLLTTLFSGMLWAQIPDGYYASAEGKTGLELRKALHNIIKNHTVRGYSSLGSYFGYTDMDADMQYIVDIYSNQHYTLDDAGGSSSSEGNGWNKEHTWPQSWLNGNTPKSDIFHIYPVDAKVNNMRSNLPYAEVKSVTFTSSNGCKVGTSKTAGFSGKAFEPTDEYKGDIARTYFYMTTRYYTEDSSWGSSSMTNKCEIEPWAIKMLLEWNKKDPVSQKEIDRNNAVYNIVQFNRNPFIDHPEYAEMIWGENIPVEDYYTITCATGLEHGSISAPEKAAKGSTVTITAKPDAGYMIDTWSAWKTGSPTTTVSISEKGTFTMPEYDVTVSATFKEGAAMGDFAKVTSAPDDWSGTYLIVYEGENVALDGSLGTETMDAVANTISVSIADNTIVATEETNAAVFTIAKNEDGYSIMSASGLYVGHTGTKNTLNVATTPIIHDISLAEDGSINLTCGEYSMKFNDTKDQKRFRYYKSGQKAIHLYKKAEAAEPADVTITFHNGSDSYTQTVKANEETTLTPCTFTNDGFVFYGWNTDAEGKGEYYGDGADVTLTADLDLYAQWDELFTVTVEKIGNGTVDVTPTEAVEGTTITVEATPAEGFTLESITVTDVDDNTIEMEDNEFEMPASNVFVKVVFGSPSTGIIDYSHETIAPHHYFDLQGRSVFNSLKKGVYIRNGKKIIIK